MRRPVLLIAIPLLLIWSLMGSANSLLASDFKSDRKIIVFNEGTNLDEGVKKVENLGAINLKKLDLINAVVVKVPSSKVEKKLKDQQEVLRIEEDLMVSTHGKPTDKAPQPTQILPWGIDRIDAELAWTNGTGFGVKVAVLDTGIDVDHPDLIQNLKGGFNAIGSPKKYDDDNGHGTHVAGIIAGINNDIGIVGVSPGASLFAVKVLDASGNGYISDVIEGLQWVINNGMQIVNMSFGMSTDSLSLHEAVQAAYNAGIILVASAGNLGPQENSVTYPAKYTETIAVSALDKFDNIALFSSTGPEIDFVSPGVNVLSSSNDGTYQERSGTSMAAPHVTGTAALALSVKGLMPPSALKEYLTVKVENLGLISIQQGVGLIDAQAVVQP